ncbi:hypothetical protein F0225_07570 [Vibrio pectenicida]|uniref:PatG domain-containing protein n=1 Tax=Vibrio pectenicida TaxID=62763 RepID=A0A7Y4EDY6_9VIBR|nr:hypothetical protein [Vibrio pectenicida]NOH71194.1 hypothetical protein [Vibrio pectenicida]
MGMNTFNQVTGESYVYALGSIRPYLSNRDLQKEFDAAAKTLGLANDDYYGVFSYSETTSNNQSLTFRPYAYIAEKVSWVFTINDVDTYMVVPKYTNELDALIAALNHKTVTDIVALIGSMREARLTPSDSDLQLPSVVCNHVITQPMGQSSPIAIKPNDGFSASRRALNYLVFNFNTLIKGKLDISGQLIDINYQIYTKDPKRLLVEMILTYKNQNLESFYSCGIDVTDEYPFVDFPLRNFVPKAA